MFFPQAVTVPSANFFVSGHFKPILYLCVSSYNVEPPTTPLNVCLVRYATYSGAESESLATLRAAKTAGNSRIKTCGEQTGWNPFCTMLEPTPPTPLRYALLQIAKRKKYGKEDGFRIKDERSRYFLPVICPVRFAL